MSTSRSSKANHTPGPWTVEGRGTTVKMGERAYAGVDQNVGVPFSEAEANACLIAAAPDLLAACISAADMFQRLMDQFGELDELEQRTLKACRSAIAKARGEVTGE